MRGGWLALGVGALLAGCVDRAPEGEMRESQPPHETLATCDSPRPTFEIEELARGLEVVWDFAPAPDGRLFVTERPGRIRVIDQDGLHEESWFELDVEHREEAGLMGITLARDFATSGHLFVASSHLRPPPLGGIPVLSRLLHVVRIRTAGDRGTALVNRVHRITDQEGRGHDPVLWVDAMPTGILHAGGALVTRPDGDLLLSLGDGMDPWRAQQPSSLRGTLVRIPVGEGPPPSERIRPGSDVVAFGVRNSQGMAWLDSDSTELAFIDHGPTGRDELNLFESGGNYGWPAEAGIVEDPRFVPPLAEWTPAIAPGGLAAGVRRDGDEGDAADGADAYDGQDAVVRVHITGLGGQTLREVELVREEEGWRARCEHRLLDGEYGRLRAIAPAPDGGLFLGTSNLDGRGVPREGGDRVLHLRWLDGS